MKIFIFTKLLLPLLEYFFDCATNPKVYPYHTFASRFNVCLYVFNFLSPYKVNR